MFFFFLFFCFLFLVFLFLVFLFLVLDLPPLLLVDGFIHLSKIIESGPIALASAGRHLSGPEIQIERERHTLVFYRVYSMDNSYIRRPFILP